MNKLRSLILLLLVVTASGCTHHLQVKNINDYQPSSFVTLSNDLSIGIITQNSNSNGKVLVTGTARAMSSYVGQIVYPYQPNRSKQVDIVTKITVKPDHKGSGANFFINFPGFLIWAPAWNGYVYKPSYDIDVELVAAAEKKVIDSFTVPVRLNIRHADIGRTWTEVSWFEVGSIALISGFVFIQYDDEVTPLVENEIKRTIGDYVAQEIATRLSNSVEYKRIIEGIENKERL